MSKILPTKKEFQTIANDIKIESNITRCQAYEKLARKYGYKIIRISHKEYVNKSKLEEIKELLGI